jgi:hypothetical protein
MAHYQTNKQTSMHIKATTGYLKVTKLKQLQVCACERFYKYFEEQKQLHWALTKCACTLACTSGAIRGQNNSLF